MLVSFKCLIHGLTQRFDASGITVRDTQALARDDCSSMIFPENRFALFRIVLWRTGNATAQFAPALCTPPNCSQELPVQRCS